MSRIYIYMTKGTPLKKKRISRKTATLIVLIKRFLVNARQMAINFALNRIFYKCLHVKSVLSVTLLHSLFVC